MRKKITVVGAGNVGATVAQRLFERGYADVVLVDIVKGLPQGKALDMLESGPVLGTDSQITGTNSYEDTAGSDVAVITAGVARRPGMSRDDLLFTNMDIVGGVAEQIARYSPQAILIVVSNPLDAMAQQTLNVTHFPGSGNRDGWYSGYRPFPHLSVPGDQGLRGGCAGIRPRRPRRHHGAPGRLHHRGGEYPLQG